jgi:hypothetical protein
MTIDKVIELGRQIQKPDMPWHSQFTFSIWVWIISAIMVGLALIIWSFAVVDSGFRAELGMFIIGISIIFYLIIGVTSDYKAEKIYESEISNWQETIAKPYIESLPKEKKVVVYIKIEPELSHAVQANYYWGTGYTRSTEITKTPLVVSYKDKGIVTLTNWYETYMELTNEVKPYIEFQRLEKDLGHGVNAGNYNQKIYLPESYEFMEIK